MNIIPFRVIWITLFLLIIVGCKTKINEPIISKDPYTGITETGSDSPDIIGNFDPDDWKFPADTNKISLKIFPAYPNPTNGIFNFAFQIPQMDSISIYIDDWPNNRIIQIKNNWMNAGSYYITINLKTGFENIQRKEGIVRLFFKMKKAAFSTYDIDYLKLIAPFKRSVPLFLLKVYFLD